jgi:hypothetical protein
MFVYITLLKDIFCSFLYFLSIAYGIISRNNKIKNCRVRKAAIITYSEKDKNAFPKNDIASVPKELLLTLLSVCKNIDIVSINKYKEPPKIIT